MLASWSLLAPLLLLGGIVGTPVAFALSIAATIAFRGAAWRIAAALPLFALGGYVAFVLLPSWLVSPSSHNLWPLEVGIFLSPSLPYVVVLWLAYRRAHRPADSGAALSRER